MKAASRHTNGLSCNGMATEGNGEAEEWARLYHFPNEMGALGTIHFPNT